MRRWTSCICSHWLIGWKIVQFDWSVFWLMEFMDGWLLRICIYCFWSSVVDCGVVDWEFFFALYWWPSDGGIEWGMNLRTLISVMNGHVDKLLSLMAFIIVPVVGLPMDQCRKVRVSFMVTSGRTALICGSNLGMDGWSLDAFGNLHSLVDGSLYPVKIVRPPFIPVHVVLWTLLHPHCHIVQELEQGVLAYFWIFMPFLRSLAVRTFSFGTKCVLQFYSCLVAVPLLDLFVDHIRSDYSCTDNLMWRHYLLSGM